MSEKTISNNVAEIPNKKIESTENVKHKVTVEHRDNLIKVLDALKNRISQLNDNNVANQTEDARKNISSEDLEKEVDVTLQDQFENTDEVSKDEIEKEVGSDIDNEFDIVSPEVIKQEISDDFRNNIKADSTVVNNIDSSINVSGNDTDKARYKELMDSDTRNRQERDRILKEIGQINDNEMYESLNTTNKTYQDLYVECRDLHTKKRQERDRDSKRMVYLKNIITTNKKNGIVPSNEDVVEYNKLISEDAGKRQAISKLGDEMGYYLDKMKNNEVIKPVLITGKERKVQLRELHTRKMREYDLMSKEMLFLKDKIYNPKNKEVIDNVEEVIPRRTTVGKSIFQLSNSTVDTLSSSKFISSKIDPKNASDLFNKYKAKKDVIDDNLPVNIDDVEESKKSYEQLKKDRATCWELKKMYLSNIDYLRSAVKNSNDEILLNKLNECRKQLCEINIKGHKIALEMTVLKEKIDGNKNNEDKEKIEHRLAFEDTEEKIKELLDSIGKEPNQGKKVYRSFRDGEKQEIPVMILKELNRLNGESIKHQKALGINVTNYKEKKEETYNVLENELPKTKLDSDQEQKIEYKKTDKVLTKKKRKKILVGLAAAAAVALCLLGFNKHMNKDVVIEDINTGNPLEIEIDSEIPESEIKKEIDKVIEDIADLDKEIANEDEYVISLGDAVNVSDSAMVYKDSYSASAKTNGYTKYFDNNETRYVEGVTYELNGQLTTIYSTNSNADDMVKSLVDQGAILTAVLTSVDGQNNQFEGYYEPSSISEMEKVR